MYSEFTLERSLQGNLMIMIKKSGNLTVPQENIFKKDCFPLCICAMFIFGSPSYKELSLTQLRQAVCIYMDPCHWQFQFRQCQKIDIGHMALCLPVFPSTLPKTAPLIATWSQRNTFLLCVVMSTNFSIHFRYAEVIIP